MTCTLTYTMLLGCNRTSSNDRNSRVSNDRTAPSTPPREVRTGQVLSVHGQEWKIEFDTLGGKHTNTTYLMDAAVGYSRIMAFQHRHSPQHVPESGSPAPYLNTFIRQCPAVCTFKQYSTLRPKVALLLPSLHAGPARNMRTSGAKITQRKLSDVCFTMRHTKAFTHNNKHFAERKQHRSVLSWQPVGGH